MKMFGRSQCWLLLAMCGLASSRAFALEPNRPPGGNFDLSHWYLTLPDSSASTISSSKLVGGYTNAAWFYTGADGSMVFYSPVNGGTTDNSIHPRTELRELIDGSSTSVNWPWAGTHILEGQCKILQLPSSGQLWFGQIHGYEDDAPVLMLLRYNAGNIEIQMRTHPNTPSTNYFPLTSAALNELISYRIQVVNGLLSVTVNGVTQVIDVAQYDPEWVEQSFYFKAGVYCQDNSGPSSEGARVAYYYLQASHPPPPVAPSITTQPTSASTNEGAAASFRVLFKGTAPLAFQWRKNGAELPDATNSVLTIPSVGTNNLGNYQVVLSNVAGSVTSVVANLSLLPPPPPPPGSNFDLTHWYLTSPEANAPIISPAQLVAGYTHPLWFYSAADGAMVFWCPVNGGTTANSSYPRSELREMLDPLDTAANWTGYGTHILKAQCKVTQLPSNGRVIIGQIHGYIDGVSALVLLRYAAGKLEAEVRTDSSDDPEKVTLALGNFALNQLITYEIRMVDGLVSVTANGVTKSVNVFQSGSGWAEQTFYFKAGSYCQDNSGSSSEGARLAFYQLSSSHVHAPQPPQIATQPVSQGTNATANVSFRAIARGRPPLFFQWHKAGAALMGETNSILALSNVGTNDAGFYYCTVTNNFGSVTSATVTLTVLTPPNPLALAEALDTTGLVWSFTGTPAWFDQTEKTHDGTDAAQSGAISHSKTTSMQTTVTGPGTVGFWWKVSSEPSNDRLLFYVGSSEKARITGETDWQWKTFSISSGSQILKWTYSKNSSKTGGVDSAWVDQVIFVPNNVATVPIIAVHPVGTNVDAGGKATFSVVAIGSPTLRYQWQLNGTNLTNSSSAGISGATTATLTLSAIPLAGAGAYSVIVSNTAGAVVSSNAFLSVTPVLTLAEALDTSTITWTTSSSLGWTGQTNVTHDSTDAARSGAIADDKSTYVQATVTGPGVLKFWWKVSSDPNDRLRFYVKGAEQARISGEVDWTQRVYNLPSGSQALQWKYSKDDEDFQGQDHAWVDQVEFTPNAAPSPLAPPSLAQLVPVEIGASSDNVLLTWKADPEKSYQVLYIDSIEDAEWNELTAEVSFTNSVGTCTDAVAGLQRFYRVVEK